MDSRFLHKARLIFMLLLFFSSLSVWAQERSLAERIAAREQLTNIPTVYLTVPDAEGKDINDVLTKVGNVAEYHAATIQVVDNGGTVGNFTDNKLEIKVRGNSTATDSKKPYRLKFGKDVKDEAGNVTESHKHDMLGLGYAKRNWTLLTNHKDQSLLHNALTYHVGKAVGMDFCPGYKFVDLVINGEYRGNYQISDHVEVGSNRVDVDEDTGWFIEAARGDMVEEPLVEVAGLRMSIKNPEPANAEETAQLKANVTDYFQKLNRFWGVYSTPCSMEEFVSTSGWTAYIDEESLARFYVGINLTDDYDGFMTVKMYREADGKLKFGPLWDKDLAYGNWQNHGKLCEEYQPGYTFCDHMARMMTDPYFVKKVHDKLHEVVDAGFVANMQAQIYAIGTELTASQALNQSKWWTCDNYPAAQKEFADYIDEHTAFFVNAIDEKYDAMDCASLGERPGGNEGGDASEGTGGSDGHACPYETTLGEWQNVPLPSSAVHPRATAVSMKVVGTSFFLLMNSNSESDKIDQYSFSWDGANMSGREFDITDKETLDKLKAGSLYVRCGGGSATVTITCTVPEDIGPTECTHTFTTTSCTTDADGILHRTCAECGAEESDANYYKFTVYPESGETYTVIEQSWTPSADKPNSIALVKITSGLEANIEGYNIVNSTKNADGDQTCADLRLADGHPYYSDKKFVAAKATYVRPLATDEVFGMMTLPFKHQDAENDDAAYYHINKVEDNNICLTPIDPAVDGNASAYLPVMFKRKDGATSITVTGTDVTVKKSTSAAMSNSTCEGWTIMGAMGNTSVTADGNSLYELADSKLGTVARTSSLTIAPFRAYLTTTASAPSALTFIISQEEEISVTTLVDAINQLKSGKLRKQEVDDIANELLNQQIKTIK